MLKKICCAALLIAGSINPAAAQCTTPLTSINEDFQSFQEDSFPQNCWTASTTQTIINDWYGDGNLGAFLLTGPGSQNPSYLVSPLATFNETHTLAFDASGTGKIEVGTMTSATDFSTFVPLASYNLYANRMQYHLITPVMATPKHIAFKLVPAATTSHFLLDNVTLPSPLGCEIAVDTFNENFSAFQPGSVSQNCWAANFDESFISLSSTPTRYMVFTCEPTENAGELYIVSPMLTSVTGSHTLSFRASGVDGQYQAGTMASPYDFGSFIPSGAAVPIVIGQADYSVPISGPATHHYVALKFTVAPGFESAIGILRRIAFDESLSTDDLQKENIKIYPNPATSLLNVEGVEGDVEIRIFDLNGRQVLQSNKSATDVSALSAGVYVLIVESESKTSNHKLVKE